MSETEKDQMLYLQERVVRLRGNGCYRDILLREYQPSVVQTWVLLAFATGFLVGVMPGLWLLSRCF